MITRIKVIGRKYVEEINYLAQSLKLHHLGDFNEFGPIF